MTEALQEELAKVGLQLSSAQTKALTLEALDRPLFLEVSGECEVTMSISTLAENNMAT